jgi:hypothetical protein
LRGTLFGTAPDEEPHREPVLAPADLRIVGNAARERDPHQLRAHERSIWCWNMPAGAVSGRPGEDSRVSHSNCPMASQSGLRCRIPGLEVLVTLRFRETQPVLEVRQVELTGAAGDGAAMPDRGQELRAFQRLGVVGAAVAQLLAQLGDPFQQGVEA